MQATSKRLILVGIILIILAIILGAFGAHGLKGKVSDVRIQSFEVGVRYQFYTAFGMLIVALLADRFSWKTNAFFYLNLIGVLFFSVSIYGLTLQEWVGANWKFLGPITPIGGLLMIVAWILILVEAIRTVSKN